MVMSNIPTVGAIYEAFGKGDIPTILGHLAEDIRWEEKANDHGVPWLKPGTGKAHAMAFFQALGAGLEITKFEPVQLLEGGNFVAGVIDFGATAKETGFSWTEREMHLWEFNSEGKVSGFRHMSDTYLHVTAAKGSAARV